MIEALDTEVGRLLAGVELEHTLVVFIGDNGTPSQVVEAPYNRRRAKNTLYEGGVHVPVCVRGAGVAALGRSNSDLVHTIDLFATILEAGGVELPAESDSVSMWPYLLSEASGPQRDWILSEGGGNDGRAIRNLRYKLIVYASDEEQLFDLVEDPLELEELSSRLDADDSLRGNYEELQAQLAELR